MPEPLTVEARIRVLAKVIGVPFVMVCGLAAFVVFAFAPVDDYWLRLLGFLILGTIIVASAGRIWRGGEQGTTDLEVVHGESRLTMGDIPLAAAAAMLTRAIFAFSRRPLAEPSGILRGTPAVSEYLIGASDAALPQEAE